MKTLALTNQFDTEFKAPLKIYPISDNMSWIELDLTTSEEVFLKLNDNKNMYLHFMYNLKDPILLKSIRKLAQKNYPSSRAPSHMIKRGLTPF